MSGLARALFLRHPYLALGAVFAASRLIASAAGVRFDDHSLLSYMQIIDVGLLRHRLLESLWHLHSQPPGFNALLGVALKLAPEHHAALFRLMWLGMSLASCLGVLWLLRALAVAPWASWLAAAWFCVSPGLLLHENSLFYTLPELALLVASAVTLARFTRGYRPAWGFLFFLTLAALIAIHSLFQHVFLLAALGLLLSLAPNKRAVVLAALLPLAMVMGWYGKNQILFGHFATSSWGGMNVMRTLNTVFLPQDRLEAMIAEGSASPLARIPAFSRLSHYPRRCETPARFAQVKLLTEEEKTGGFINHHHYAYLCLAEDYARDALAIVRAHPEALLRRIAAGWQGYFLPADRLFLLEEIRKPFALYGEWFDTAFFGKLPLGEDWNDTDTTVYPLLILLVCVAFARGFQLFLAEREGGRKALLGFLLMTALYVTFVGNLIEVSENHRYRFLLEPFFLALLLAPLRRADVTTR